MKGEEKRMTDEALSREEAYQRKQMDKHRENLETILHEQADRLFVPKCDHVKQKRVQMSTGAYTSQCIVCQACDQILESGQHLFNPSKADEYYSRGN